MDGEPSGRADTLNSPYSGDFSAKVSRTAIICAARPVTVDIRSLKTRTKKQMSVTKRQSLGVVMYCPDPRSWGEQACAIELPRTRIKRSTFGFVWWATIGLDWNGDMAEAWSDARRDQTHDRVASVHTD